MATTYAITYTYTGQSSWSATDRTISLSKFTASGSTDQKIYKVTKIVYTHWNRRSSHTTTDMQGRVIVGTETYNSDDVVTQVFSSENKKPYCCEIVDTFTLASPITNWDPSNITVQTLAGGTYEYLDNRVSEISWIASSTYEMTVTIYFTSAPDITYDLKIEKFEMYRASDGQRNDEGTDAWVSIKLSASGTVGSVSLTYGTSQDDISTSVRPYGSSFSVATMLSNGQECALSGEYDIGQDYYFCLTYKYLDEIVTAYCLLPRAFASLHISDCSTGGVAIGQFSSSEEGNPKFEVRHPSYFYGGIEYEWTDLTPSSNFTTPGNYGNGSLRYAKCGKHVYIAGSVQISASSSFPATIVELPSELAPSGNGAYVFAPCGNTDNYANMARLAVATNDSNQLVLRVEWLKRISNGSDVTKSTWVACNMDYWTD